MFGHRRAETDESAELLRTSLHKITRENIAIPVDSHARDGISHPYEVVGRKRVAPQRSVLAVNRRPRPRAEHLRLARKRPAVRIHDQPSQRVNVWIEHPQPGVPMNLAGDLL